MIFEQAYQNRLLAFILRSDRFLVMHRGLIEPSFFARKEQQKICQAGLLYFDKYKKLINRKDLEFLTIQNEMSDEEVSFIQNGINEIYHEELEGSDFLSDELVEFSSWRALDNATMEYSLMKQNGYSLEDAHRLFSNAIRVGDSKREEDLDFYDDVDSWIKIDQIRRIPTGYDFLDELLKGGVQLGRLVVFLAPPKARKTTFLLNLGARAIRNGFNVVHFSLETPKAEIAQKYACINFNLTEEELLLIPDSVKEKIKNMKSKWGKLKIEKYYMRRANVQALESYLMGLDFRPDVMIVDYATLLAPSRKHDAARFEYGSIIEDLKGLTDEMKIVCYTAWRTTKEGSRRNLIEGVDATETYEIAAASDLIMSINRDEEDIENGTLRLYISDTRICQDKQIFTMKIDSDRFRIERI